MEYTVVVVAPASDPAPFKYLAPYVYRTAISNNRILALSEDGQVTYCYKDNTGTRHTVTLSAERFLARFLQHVLPAGFQRIRYYGFLANRHRARKLQLCRQLLQVPTSPQAPTQEQQDVAALIPLPDRNRSAPVSLM